MTPDMRSNFDGILYCAVPAQDVERILAEGTGDRLTYWGVMDIVSYYAETIEDDGHTPVILAIRLDTLDPTMLEPDYPGIDEPISTVIGCREEHIHAAWNASGQTWHDSLNLIGSLRHKGAIAAALITVVDA